MAEKVESQHERTASPLKDVNLTEQCADNWASRPPFKGHVTSKKDDCSIVVQSSSVFATLPPKRLIFPLQEACVNIPKKDVVSRHCKTSLELLIRCSNYILDLSQREFEALQKSMDVQTILAFGSNKLGMDTPLSIPVRGCEPSWGNWGGSTHMQAEDTDGKVIPGLLFFFVFVAKELEMEMEIFFMISTEIEVRWSSSSQNRPRDSEQTE